MKYIFTDIDGVLNPHWKKNWCEKSILIYNRICRDFDLKPVITSTWRINHSKEDLQEIFYDQGIEAEIYDFTPNLSTNLYKVDRGLEIRAWIDNNIVDNFVILDDVVHNITPHINNVIRIRNWVGLTEDEYHEIKNILCKL
jgi:hypothetical protein